MFNNAQYCLMLSSYIICLHCSPAAQHRHNHHHLTPSLENDSLLNQVYTRDWDSSTTDNQWYSGAIQEGYWKDGELYGRGRGIFYDRDYYIGEYKEGSRNGDGAYYKANGDKYISIISIFKL